VSIAPDWLTSGRPAANQPAIVALPLHDQQWAFLGIQPGTVSVNSTAEWQFLAGPAFTAEPGQRVNLSIRLQTDGGAGSVEFALPRIPGPADAVFADRFQ